MRITESTIFPYACADAPQELLPIIPPIVQVSCVDGFGPTISPCSASSALRSSRHAPGSTSARRAVVSTESRRLQYFDQSMTTPSLQHCPARLVPPPRERTGTPCSRHTRTVSTAASALYGTTTPTGGCQ